MEFKEIQDKCKFITTKMTVSRFNTKKLCPVVTIIPATIYGMETLYEPPPKYADCCEENCIYIQPFFNVKE